MKKIYLFYLALLILLPSLAYPQIFRIKALGGMTLALKDEDNSFNLYDFGNNPAWLINDEKQSWLEIIPSFNKGWGDYRRLFDPKENSIYSAKFDGVKTLGDIGTFRGYASYGFENRKDVYRSLTRYPYSGEAFFMIDTTIGNFNYNGPTVGFTYSYELFSNLFIGALLQYQLLDGIKEIYSRAKTLYRSFEGNIGIAYQAADNLAVGLSLEPFDIQERIESKSEDLFDAEIFNYRGETYAFKRRGQSIDQKLREKGANLGSQINWLPISGLNIGLKGSYLVSTKKVIIPLGLLKETEEGFASFENYDFQFLSRYYASDVLTFGFSARHSNRDSWSKYSAKDLLLWKWNIKETAFGLGTTYEIIPRSLLVGIEAEFGNTTSDSSKYIDNKFSFEKSSNFVIRTGAEYEIVKNIFLRLGYVSGFMEFDVVRGGRDINFSSITSGIGINIFKSFYIDFYFDYTNYSPKNSNDSYSTLNSFVSIKLFTF